MRLSGYRIATRLSFFRISVRLSDYRIKTRIYLGFGAVILLGAGVAGSGIWEFTALGRQVDRLVAASDNVTRNLEVNRIAEALRRTGLQYKLTGDDAAVLEFAEQAAKAARLIADAAKSAATTGQRQLCEAAGGEVAAVQQEFGKLSAITKQRPADGWEIG